MPDHTRAEVQSQCTQDGRTELKETRLAAGAAEGCEEERFVRVAHLAGPAAQPGQLKDAFARLGDGRGWLLLEGGADQLAIGGHLAHRATEIPLPQAVQAPLPKRGHVSLDGGPTDSDSLGRMLTREPGVQQPKHEHLFADAEVGMTAPFLVDDALLFLGQPHAKPGHGVPPCVTSQSG